MVQAWNKKNPLQTQPESKRTETTNVTSSKINSNKDNHEGDTTSASVMHQNNIGMERHDCMVSVEPETLQSEEKPRSAETQKKSEGSSSQLLSSSIEKSPATPNDVPLQGIGNQGGRLWVEGGGQLKARLRQSQPKQNESDNLVTSDNVFFSTPVSVMQIEVHIQCRMGRTSAHDAKMIAMTPDPDRDRVHAVLYVYAMDPGGGEPLEYLEKGCLFTPLERELQSDSTEVSSERFDQLSQRVKRDMPRSTMGVSSPLTVECLRDERQLLLRFASIVRQKDPDMLLSWDTQGTGLGYIIQRGVAVGKNVTGDTNESAQKEIDMARLLGRTPTAKTDATGNHPEISADDAAGAALDDMAEKSAGVDGTKDKPKLNDRWKGSGLGSEWDERVGAGTAAASIVSHEQYGG